MNFSSYSEKQQLYFILSCSGFVIIFPYFCTLKEHLIYNDVTNPYSAKAVMQLWKPWQPLYVICLLWSHLLWIFLFFSKYTKIESPFLQRMFNQTSIYRFLIYSLLSPNLVESSTNFYLILGCIAFFNFNVDTQN